MQERKFRILNVFTIDGDPFSGNPLCVFEDARGLSDAQMLGLARQMNLSETTFVFPPDDETTSARVRIFTPSFEMPFAGHPTLGTAHVVRDLTSTKDAVSLAMKVGRVEVTAKENTWTLRAAQAPVARASLASRDQIASMIGLENTAIAADPQWIDTGAEQLVIPLASPADVERAKPNAELLATHGWSEKRGASMAYVFAKVDVNEVLARFFFLVNGGVVEDPATGSACANLGGYLIATKHAVPITWSVSQGTAIARASRLALHVNDAHAIFVSGDVREIARGTMTMG